VPASILYVITELDIGGAEKALYGLVRRLDRRRYAPEVACLSGRGAVGAWLAALDVPVHYLYPASQRPSVRLVVGALWRLRRLVREVRPDLVHTVLFHANLIGRLAVLGSHSAPPGPGRGRPGHRPVVVSAVRVAERRYRWHLLGDYLTSHLVDREVCVSKGVRRFTERCARIPAQKLCVIPNGVDLPAIDAVRPADLTALGCRPGRPTIAYVGRLDPQKGLSHLLRALAGLSQTAWQLVLAGDGPQRTELETFVASLGLADRVRFLGWRPDALSIVAACDLFVMPSLWEGMPNAVMEAMALGKCVVATAVEGTEDLMEDGVSGLLVPARQSQALAEAIRRALADADLRDRLGAAARERIRAHYSIDRVVAQHDALYQSLLRM
jgi:glycosyltransferase involved in cell wall biosynthesis